MTVRVATYTRISTDEEHQPYSLEAQDQRLRAYIRSQEGWELTRQFSDQMSGSTLERPNLQRALAEARAHRYDLLLVYRLDRLVRSVRGLSEILHDLDKVGVVFRSATEPFDTGSPAGRMMVQMLGVFAEFERATIIDRVIAGMERKAARGGWNGGYVPFGYRFISRRVASGNGQSPVVLTSGFLEVDPDRAPLVKVIFDLYVNKRLGSRAIANWLTERGHRGVSGHPWNFKSVLTILRNRVYISEVFFRGKWHPAPHPSLVDRATFDKALDLLVERGEDYARRAAVSSDYLLGGLVICQSCGHHMLGNAAHGRSARYRYYTCFRRHRYGKQACDAESIHADRLEQAVLDSLLRTFEDHAVVDRAVAEFLARANAARPEREEQLAAVGAEIHKAEEALDRYFLAFENGTMSEERCAPRIEALGEKLRALKARQIELTDAIEEQRVHGPSAEELAAIREKICHVVSSGPDGERKALLQDMVSEVRVRSRRSIVPVFRLHLRGPSEGEGAVRHLSRLVGPLGFEPRTNGL